MELNEIRRDTQTGELRTTQDSEDSGHCIVNHIEQQTLNTNAAPQWDVNELLQKLERIAEEKNVLKVDLNRLRQSYERLRQRNDQLVAEKRLAIKNDTRAIEKDRRDRDINRLSETVSHLQNNDSSLQEDNLRMQEERNMESSSRVQNTVGTSKLKRLYRRLKKTTLHSRITFGIVVIFLLGVVVTGLYFVLIRTDDEGLDTTTRVRLNETIEIVYPVLTSDTEDVDEVNLTTSSGETFPYKFPSVNQNHRIRRSDDEWQISRTETSDQVYLTFTGPNADCDARGVYKISLIKDGMVVYTQTRTVEIESQLEITGQIERLDTNEKEFKCLAKTDCMSSHIEMLNNDNTRTSLTDMKAACTKEYNKYEGFKSQCVGTTHKSELVCALESELSDEDHPKSQILSECNNSPCLNGGTCHVPEAGVDFICICGRGFRGPICETDVNECESNPCVNGATCEDLVGAYSCICAAGFSGLRCEEDIDECKDVVCQNGGDCLDLVNDYSCVCRQGFTGKHCDQDVDECVSEPCLNGGSCLNYIGRYECRCAAGYSGATCQAVVNECESSPCGNGDCVDEIGRYSCSCWPGFTGSQCEQEINPCDSKPCINDGTCGTNEGSFSCTCPVGFTGNTCETQIDYCSGVDCNNGICQQKTAGGFECVCEEGFTGNLCEKAVVGVSCTDDTDCVENAGCLQNVCTCQKPYITASDQVTCTYGCNTNCTGYSGDSYSISGDPCGSQFKRCVNGKLFVQPCKADEVFSPLDDDCTCVRREDAGWCKAGISDTALADVCAKTCSKLSDSD